MDAASTSEVERDARPIVSDGHLATHLQVLVPRARVPVYVAVLSLSLTIPSAGLVWKYGGYLGLTGYVGITTALLWMAFGRWRTKVLTALSERTALIGIIFLFLGVVVAAAAIHPSVDAQMGDANEALNYSVREILHRRYPYYVRTQLGNLISPMPGAIFLSLPFVLLGDSAYQNYFWLAALLVLVRWLIPGWRQVLMIFAAMLLFSPVIGQNLILGGDRLSNELYVLISMVLLVGVSLKPGRGWQWIASALFAGIALSSRGQYLFLLPVVMVILAQRRGWRFAGIATAVVLLACAVVTLPFYFYDPSNFTPLLTIRKLAPAFWGAQAGALVLFFGVACLLAWRYRKSTLDFRGLFEASGILQAAIFVVALSLFAFASGSAGATFAFAKEGYGLNFLFYGVLASGIALFDAPGLKNPLL